MIVFRNPQLIDLRCIRSFGVNVKPLSTNPIGAFGSGLKVALSCLLRTNHSVCLWRGLDRYSFGTQPVNIRGKSFDMITMIHPDSTVEELSFNTHVGEHWPDYAPYRELHSNALDEGGETIKLDGSTYQPRENETAFIVVGDGIERAHAMRDQIFLKTAPLFVGAGLNVHPGQSPYVYYRGVRVMDLQKPSLYTYNLTELLWGLTEDRTLKQAYDLDRTLSKVISSAKDPSFLERILLAPAGSFEYDLDATWQEDPSEEFMEVYAKARQNGRMAELTSFANSGYKRKHKYAPLPEPVQLNGVKRKQLAKAVAFCKKMEWTVDEYPIIVVPHARGGLLAWAQDDKIIITMDCFDQGTKSLASTLLEEWMHLKHGFKDLSRELQTYLFNQIITLGEELNGEPL